MAKHGVLASVHLACARLEALVVLASLSLALMAIPVKPSRAQGTYTCPGNPPPQLVIGTIALVAPGAPDHLRQDPSLASPVLAPVTAGTQFLVTGGPTCADGLTWWQVDRPDGPGGLGGWIAEGHGSQSYLLPFAAPLATQTNTFTLPDNAAAMNVSLDGISFTYTGFAGPTVQVKHSLDFWIDQGGWVESYQFRFSPDPSLVANLIVVKNGSHFFGKAAMTDLAGQLKTHPALPANKPIEYIQWGVGSEQLFHAQEAYLTLPNLVGLRFITEYVQNHVAIDGNGLRYEFIGVSHDTRAYVWEEFDVSTSLLANNPLPSSDTDYNLPDNAAAYRGYVAQTRAKLQKGTAQDFIVNATSTPGSQTTIGVLDQLLNTLVVRP